jgi:hypothetical protein
MVLVLDRGNVPDRLQESLRVVPGDPVERGELDVLEASPRPPSPDDFRFEQAKLRSPGRPWVGRHEERRRFWAAIAAGRSSEGAAVGAGVSPAVGVRWFREAGRMAASHLMPSAPPPSGRYLVFTDREQIALWRAHRWGGAILSWLGLSTPRYYCCFRLHCLQRASPKPVIVVPRRSKVVGSGVGLTATSSR